MNSTVQVSFTMSASILTPETVAIIGASSAIIIVSVHVAFRKPRSTKKEPEDRTSPSVNVVTH
jgi:hypothetical protein